MLKKRFFKTKDECEVTFEYPTQDAKEVAVVGDFTQWQAIPMKKAKKKNSPFRLSMRLPKGAEFQFRYIIDQQLWDNDSSADAYWPNEFGEENSVVKTFAT